MHFFVLPSPKKVRHPNGKKIIFPH